MPKATKFNPILAKDIHTGKVKSFSINLYSKRPSITRFNSKGKAFAEKVYSQVLEVHQEGDKKRLAKMGINAPSSKKGTGNKEANKIIADATK